MRTHLIKVITWNVAGRVKKLEQQVRAIAACRADIIALQEITETTLSEFVRLLPELGYPFVYDSFSLAKNRSVLKGHRRYGQVIASKWAMKSRDPRLCSAPWKERLLSVDIKTPIGIVEFHTTHIPPGSSNPGWTKIRQFEGIFKMLAVKTRKKRILCGDFNSPELETSSGITVPWGMTFNKKIQNYIFTKDGGKRWALGERSVLVELSNYNLHDVYRSLHGFKKKDYSWYTNNKGNYVGRRFDHIFASKQLNPIHCKYLHHVRSKGLSDHSIMETIFKV